VIDFSTGAPIGGDLDVSWIHGSPSTRHNRDPAIQVHRSDPHTFVLRQNKALHYEAPFLYLLCDNDRALLLDTGATADPERFPLRDTVDALLDGWLAEHPRASYPLVVAHTHAHSDHIAGDAQFDGRPSTSVVGTDLTAVRSFFGFTGPPGLSDLSGLSGPDADVDLGGRVLQFSEIPGHHATSVAVYDPWTGFLLTGDTVYRGRLYVEDFPAFLSSLDRLVAITMQRPVTQVLGCHIEMSREPGRDYPIGATYQPREPELPMTVAELVTVRDAARSVADRPGVHRFDDFLIFHGECRSAMPRYQVRAAWGGLRNLAAGVIADLTRRPSHPPSIPPSAR
jgi:hydroxyacylglutathione hydrolase